MWRTVSDAKTQSPWSSASENGRDSLAVWLIPTLGHTDDFTLFFIFILFSYFQYLFTIRADSSKKCCFFLLFRPSVFCLFIHRGISINHLYKSSGRPNVGISQTARESIPFSLALDQGDYFSI